MLKNRFKYPLYLLLAVVFSAAHGGTYEDYFQAVERNDERAVAGLLQRGFDPNTPDTAGHNGLFLALRGGSHEVASALLAHPQTRVDTANMHGETPLMMAALRGNLEWTQRLLARGSAVNRVGWSPLHYAASGPEPKVVALLLEHGAAVDARSPNGTTPLMMAARYGSLDAATLLLQRGADPRLKNDVGLAAHDFATAAGREELAGRLQRAAR